MTLREVHCSEVLQSCEIKEWPSRHLHRGMMGEFNVLGVKKHIHRNAPQPMDLARGGMIWGIRETK